MLALTREALLLSTWYSWSTWWEQHHGEFSQLGSPVLPNSTAADAWLPGKVGNSKTVLLLECKGR
jgi:hypothetical protein